MGMPLNCRLEATRFEAARPEAFPVDVDQHRCHRPCHPIPAAGFLRLRGGILNRQNLRFDFRQFCTRNHSLRGKLT